MTILNPYIAFNGNTREAMEFYKSVFGGKLDINTYKEGGMSQSPEDEEKIMHAQLTSEKGFTLMAGDMTETSSASNISISLSGDAEEELKGYWDKLSEEATIIEPLKKAPWGDTFGALTDKFGVGWMINIAGAQA